jgi:hypothetical protein
LVGISCSALIGKLKGWRGGLQKAGHEQSYQAHTRGDDEAIFNG